MMSENKQISVRDRKDGTEPREAPPKPAVWRDSGKPPGGRLPKKHESRTRR